MASLYDLSVENVTLDINDKISTMTIKVLNGSNPVTNLEDNSFVIHTPTNFATKIAYTIDSQNSDKPNGIYVITFTIPQTKKDPLMIYAQAADETKLSRTLYYDYAEFATEGIINTNFNLNKPGTYNFELDKVNSTVLDKTTAKSVTISHPAAKNSSKIEIVNIDTDLVQIIPDTGYVEVPLKLTLIGASGPVNDGNYQISICNNNAPAPTPLAKPSSKEEEPK